MRRKIQITVFFECLLLSATALTVLPELFPDVFLRLPGNIITAVNMAKVALAFLFILTACLFGVAAKDGLLFLAAYFFTFIADWYLAINPISLEKGVAAFILVQWLYGTVLLLRQKNRVLRLSLRVTATVTAVFAALYLFHDGITPLLLLVAVYAASLLLNVIYALSDIRRMPAFSWGLITFFLCDATIGLHVGSEMGILRFGEASPLFRYLAVPFDFVWFFYSFTHCLLPLAALRKNK